MLFFEQPSGEPQQTGVDSPRIGGFEWDIPSQTMLWTEELYRLHGIAPVTASASKTLIDRSIQCYDAPDRALILSAFQGCCETGDPYDLELPFTPVVGKRIWIRTIGCAVLENAKPTKVIGSFIDTTHQHELNETLIQNEESFRLLAQFAPVPIVFLDKVGRIEFQNLRFTETFGYCSHELPDLHTWWELVCPDETSRKEAQLSWERAIDPTASDKSDIRQREVSVLGKNGKSHVVEVFGARIGHKHLVVLNDVTERKLAAEARMLERRDAERALQNAVDEQTALLKEVHHRVKNNLQIVSSLLNLQAAKLRDSELRKMLANTQNRVRSIALLHETLYRSENLAQIKLPEYVENLCAHLLRAIGPDSGNIKIIREIETIAIPLDQAVPCGLIINELVTNALKHAFPDGRPGRILIRSEAAKAPELRLTVGDDGIGLPVEIDPETTETLGLQLVTILSEQLHGSLEIVRGSGTLFRLIFSLQQKDNRNTP